MNGQEGRAGWRAAMLALAVLGIGFIIWSLEAKAQQAPEAPTEAAAEPAATPEEAPAADEAAVEGALSDEELQALVAPVALYPDLVLVLTLQASLVPLDIVQADRFLAQYAEDPSLEPDPDWDESVIGLLNYPTVVKTMSADLEWTETLGTAVIDQLEGVQGAIQEFRGFMRAIGALESNEQTTVIAEGDVIRIEPTDENAVFIPQYDADALLAALYSTDVDLEPAETGAEVSAEPGTEAVEGSADEEMTETAEVEDAAPVEEAPPAEEAPPLAEPVPAAAPAYYPAVAPPPVTYSDPSPSWLGTAATFAGGAAVGGLVGWAIADDDGDDDDDDDWDRGNIDIEDSNIVVNRGDGDQLDDLQRQAQDERLERAAREKAQREQAKLKLENEHLKREARQTEQRAQTKRELEQRYPDRQPREAQARAGGQRKVAGLSTSGSTQPGAATRSSAGGREVAAKVDQAKAKSAPPRKATGQARASQSTKAARPGDRKQAQAAGAFGGKKSATQARRDSDRGLKSRSGAKTDVKPHRSQGGNSAFAQRGGGGGKARGGSRGKKSRGGRG